MPYLIWIYGSVIKYSHEKEKEIKFITRDIRVSTKI